MMICWYVPKAELSRWSFKRNISWMSRITSPEVDTSSPMFPRSAIIKSKDMHVRNSKHRIVYLYVIFILLLAGNVLVSSSAFYLKFQNPKNLMSVKMASPSENSAHRPLITTHSVIISHSVKCGLWKSMNYLAFGMFSLVRRTL